MNCGTGAPFARRLPVTYRDALASFLDNPAGESWRGLAFFNERAPVIMAELDRRVAAGVDVRPDPADIFKAFQLTPLPSVKAVILGQDPYPTPGDANGLAFSYVGAGRLPASLKRILRELADDLGQPALSVGDLSGWARQGVLLLNAALSVEAGKAGAHLRLGWEPLADQAVTAVSRERPAVAFILWGDKARAKKRLIDERHLVIESAHPSPLAASGDFMGSRPFSRANAFLEAKGVAPIDWLNLRAQP